MPNNQLEPGDFSTVPKVAGAPYIFAPLGNAQLTVSGVVSLANAVNAGSVAVPIPAAAMMVLITVEAANVRWTDDGQTPSATFGTLLMAGQTWEYSGNLNALKFAAVSGTPLLDVAYYR